VAVISATTGVIAFQEQGAASTLAAAYKTRSADITGFAGQTILVVIQAADNATDSLVEAAVDNVVVIRQP